MNKLLGLSGMKGFDLRSFSSSGAGSAKTLATSSRATSESVSLGSFANLKLTAEKLVKEQTSAKTDLDLANCKLKKLIDDIRVLEEKLQNALNENAKLKVKQKEDEKLWKGLESKFSSTKTLCDQLTDTLQHLATQVQDAERDKLLLEEKLSTSSATTDNLHDQMKSVSLRLESLEETVRNREMELKQLHTEKKEMEKSLNTELKGALNLIEEKDSMIKSFEATVATNGLTMESLNSKLGNLDLAIKRKDEDLQGLRDSKDILNKEKDHILGVNRELSANLEKANVEIKNLEEFVSLLSVKLVDMDAQSLTFSEKVFQLITLFESCFKLLKDEKQLSAVLAQKKYDKLQDQSTRVASEKEDLQMVNQGLNNKVTELQKEQEFAVVQHAEECRLAEEKIRRLESEAETLHSQKSEMEALVAKLQENIRTISENSSLSESKMQDVMLKLSELEIEKYDSIENLREVVSRKGDEIDVLKKEMEDRDKQVDSLEKQVCEINLLLEEKDLFVGELKIREKQLEDHKAKIEESLADAETKLSEAKKEYDQMLESKQLELSRHLKEISQKNDQAINEIRRKYEVEKQESASLEKEKADKTVREMERKCDQKLEECKEESRQHLTKVQDEHAALICRIQQERDKKEALISSSHAEEIKRLQLQAENELREKTALLRSEHEDELRALQREHHDECLRLQEELDVQKAKEERQRALLQLQWKVMDDNPQDEQEVNSKKVYSISSGKVKNSGSDKRVHHVMDRRDTKDMDSPYLKATQTPATKKLRKVDKENTEDVTSLPKQRRKVTRHEYEVETTNGGTITKKRKTKSTVMFGDPRKSRTPTVKTPRVTKVKTPRVTKVTKRRNDTDPSNIGDLFSEGSLNPYADDPYAFD